MIKFNIWGLEFRCSLLAFAAYLLLLALLCSLGLWQLGRAIRKGRYWRGSKPRRPLKPWI